MNLQRPFIPSPEFMRQNSKSADGRSFSFKSASAAIGTTFTIKNVREANGGVSVEAVLCPEFADYKALKAHFGNRKFAELRGQSNRTVPAGKVINLSCDDANREISLLALVSDPSEISKTREGLYTAICLSANEANLLDTSVGG